MGVRDWGLLLGFVSWWASSVGFGLKGTRTFFIFSSTTTIRVPLPELTDICLTAAWTMFPKKPKNVSSLPQAQSAFDPDKTSFSLAWASGTENLSISVCSRQPQPWQSREEYVACSCAIWHCCDYTTFNILLLRRSYYKWAGQNNIRPRIITINKLTK